jgi:hypothetical protein
VHLYGRAPFSRGITEDMRMFGAPLPEFDDEAEGTPVDDEAKEAEEADGLPAE